MHQLYLAIDPGRHIGVATFTDTGDIIMKRTLDNTQFLQLLSLLDGQLRTQENMQLVIIAEDFKLRKDKALEQTGSEMPAPKVIGMLELFHALHPNKTKLHMQDPKYLSTGLKWAGNGHMVRKGYHPPDDCAAEAHGVYYLVQTQIRTHPIFLKG